MKSLLSLLLLSFFLLSDFVSHGQESDDSLCLLFRTAAYDGDLDAIQALIDTTMVDVDCYSPGETTALCYAIQGGYYDIVERLLSYDANPDGIPEQPIAPLSLAVIHNQFEIAELLILYGASPDPVDYLGLTPLFMAIRQGNFLMADMLLHYGADPRISLSDGSTPLHIAAMYRDFEMADRLIECGSGPNITDTLGFTPLMIAAANNDTLLGQRLLDAGAIPSIVNCEGWDALALAIEHSAKGMIKMLTPWEEDHSKTKIMNLAYVRGDRQTLKFLQSSGFQRSWAPLPFSHDIINELTLNGKNLYLSHRYGLREARYNLRIGSGLEYRLLSAVVRFEPDDNDTLLYQLKSNRYQLFFTLEKFVTLAYGQWGTVELALGIRPGYSWGSYRGTEMKPWKGFSIGYSGGLLYRKAWFSAGVQYIYQDFHDIPVPRGRMGFAIGIHLPQKKYIITPKEFPYELSNERSEE